MTPIKMDSISYRLGNDFDIDAVVALYRESSLGERRPVDNRTVMESMIRTANLTVTAWDKTKLIGISRTLTDFAYVAYLADLAVHLDYQKMGIGSELVSRTRAALKPTCLLTLLAAPKANEFYPKIGFEHHPRAWVIGPEVDPKTNA